MSKLKRKKSAVEESKPDLQKKTGARPERLHIPDAAPRTPAECGTAGVGSSWWIGSGLTEAEKLWVITLNDFCPKLTVGDGMFHVPELPPIPTALQGDQRNSGSFWCSVDADVPPLPPPPPRVPLEISILPSSSPLTSAPTPDPQNPSDLSSSPVHPEPHRTLSQEEVRDQRRSGSGTEAGTSGSTSGLRLSEKRSGSGSGLGSGPEDGIRGGSVLQCCPMCLIPFPTGFSQMECDGHLAQCLSEMNEDMVW